MRILITGGAGFIGSDAADELLGDGHSVTVIDDLSSGNIVNVPAGATFLRLSLDSPDVAGLFESGRFDAVLHCAAQVKVIRSMEDPLHDLKVNLLGTAALLDHSRAFGASRFIFLSTGGAVYGETDPTADEDTLPRPLSYYAIHKYAAERYIELSGLSYAILRLANVYGARQRADLEGGVVSVFTDRLLAGEPIDIFGDGEQIRDYVYVGDVVGAIRAMLSNSVNGTWNVGTGVPTSVKQLLHEIAQFAGTPRAIRYLPQRPGEIFRSCLDIGRLVSTGMWRPRYTLTEGLRETVEQIRQKRGAAGR